MILLNFIGDRNYLPLDYCNKICIRRDIQKTIIVEGYNQPKVSFILNFGAYLYSQPNLASCVLLCLSHQAYYKRRRAYLLSDGLIAAQSRCLSSAAQVVPLVGF